MFNIKNIKIPSCPGSYQFKDKDGKIIYIGKAANLRSRVSSYWQKSTQHTPAKYSMLKQIKSIEWIKTDSEIEALLLEANLIKKYQPIYNVDLKDDKRFLYIKVSTEDEIPGVFATRKVERTGKYFGPFTSATAVRETLKAIRKIWPYCTERKIKNKPCFYAQIGRCLGPCGGLVGLEEYKETVIKPIILFLEGKKKRIIKNYEKSINNYELRIKNYAMPAGRQESGPPSLKPRRVKIKNTEEKNVSLKKTEEELRNAKFQLLNIKKVLEHAAVLSVGEKYAADVVELAKILGLAKVPNRIEGYDIANIFGKEAVGSMVVFKDGEPDKNEYRKFKIKIGQGAANDVGMLKEVLERRFGHAIKEEAKLLRFESNRRSLASGEAGEEKWPSPDLIVVDGGRGQLNVALKILKKNNLAIPAIAISKGDGLRSARARDKIFFPGESMPLELPVASPALHIIKRVRDEAHRFAISYHRLLRKKKMF